MTIGKQGTRCPVTALILTPFLAMATPPPMVFAADSSSPNLEEIVVTAQKRDERLQEVPISISVLGGADLDKSSDSSITDALNNVPGVATTVGAQGGGTQLAVRGVSANGPLFSGSSPIAYYVDSIPFGLVRSAVEPDFSAFDMDRIEVLRGPQGTLYGASALNGVVRVLTKDPDLSNFDFKARTTLSTTDGGGENYRGDMAVNVPIIEGKLAARVVIGDEDLSGWINSPVKNHVNDAELRNLRLKILAQPTDELSIGLSAWRSEANYGAPSQSTESRTISSLVPQPISTDVDTYGLKVGYIFPAFTISSMTSYLKYANGGDLDLAPAGVPAPATLFTGLDSKVFSQEFNLNSTIDSAWRWSAGAFYRDGKDVNLQRFAYFVEPLDFSDTSKSSAVFGEIGRKFMQDQLELTLGIRHFHDEVGTQENIQFQGNPNVPLYSSAASFNANTPRVVLTWIADPDLTVYGSYSQGFRSGAAQDVVVEESVPGFPPYKPDKLDNYEMGTKGALWDRRVSFEAAIYYMDWKGVQQTVSVFVPGDNGVTAPAQINGSSASGLGADFGMTTRPLDGLVLGVNFSWNNLKQDSNVYSGASLLFNKGERLMYSPEYTAGASAQYSVPLSNGYKTRFTASANYTSEQSLSEVLGNGSVRALDGNVMLTSRASIAVESPDHWGISFFADNLNNEHGATVPADLPPEFALRIRPRTVGVQLDYHLR